MSPIPSQKRLSCTLHPVPLLRFHLEGRELMHNPSVHNHLIQEENYWHQTVMLNSELFTMASDQGFMLLPWRGDDVFCKMEVERTGLSPHTMQTLPR